MDFPVHHQFPYLAQTHVNHLIHCCPVLLLPSIFPFIRVFSNLSVLHTRRPKYWSFSFSISSSNEYSRLISFKIDWLDLLAVQGTLKSLLQHHSSKASILQCSGFFIGQLTHPYMTTGKTITLTRQTVVGIYTYIYVYVYKASCRRAWQPTPVFLPGESPWTEEPDLLQSVLAKNRTQLST